MLVATTAVSRRLERDLEDRHGLSLMWFDVLNRLDQGGGRLRLHELEDRSVFTRSGMTRLCDRMEAAGLVERARSTADRRGVEIVLTEQGRDTLTRVWPTHLASIEDHFGQFVDDEGARDLVAITAGLLNGLGEGLPGPSTRVDSA